jgi:hypothetical protein
MKSKGIPDVNAARNYFEDQIQTIAEGYGLRSAFWEVRSLCRLLLARLALLPSEGALFSLTFFVSARSACLSPADGSCSSFGSLQEVFDANYTLLPSSIVDIWLSDDELNAAVLAGHDVIASFGYYLDQQIPDGAQHYFWMSSSLFVIAALPAVR